MSELLSYGLIPILAIAVAALLALVAWINRDRTPFAEEGSQDPDNHTLRSDYQSGMGGGAVTTWKVPKDPDAYARLFVPKEKEK
mmetsp:Transcript_5569/g.9001  ORF Transcript_5569/g.9001 Transcript_5569/m.9001 type:complete len:84 (+) Transcript_5569:320-571(+)